jgi:hypothetical protein
LVGIHCLEGLRRHYVGISARIERRQVLGGLISEYREAA